MNKINQSWGGRFSETTDIFIQKFNSSHTFDRRLYEYDILGSIAHAKMLAQCNIISDEDKSAIVAGLKQVKEEIEQGTFDWKDELEDVHMHIEARLIVIVGEVGKKLHTGRSRNDQVATDTRLWLRKEITGIEQQLLDLQKILITLADNETDTIMPGFTHLQAAQPIVFAHHLMAYVEMFERDRSRLIDCYKRANVMPLGSAALAGTTYNIDRNITCKELSFDAISRNSLDAVSDRDFIIEFMSCASLIMVHLSRFCEEIILWNSQAFKFVDIPDRFCTGSSIMPQKKNPDVPELIRGKTGRVFGSLVQMLTVMKAQPLAYNKDNQEDKENLFDTVDTVTACLHAFLLMLPNLKANRERMREAALQGFTTATDLADYLVKKGVAFRNAHEIVGKLVATAINSNTTLEYLPLDTMQQVSTQIKNDVFKILTLEGSVCARNHFGGTAPSQVTDSIIYYKKYLGIKTQT